uniref:Uncharacterized protein n=1 Tax=Medicago truncatula TaxID=3880 RepID=Q2HUN9_MEDTR|nr:hypothetical protein MtrDRAFT_AC149130g18v2 [Medicago truncatula]
MPCLVAPFNQSLRSISVEGAKKWGSIGAKPLRRDHTKTNNAKSLHRCHHKLDTQVQDNHTPPLQNPANMNAVMTRLLKEKVNIRQ